MPKRSESATKAAKNRSTSKPAVASPKKKESSKDLAKQLDVQTGDDTKIYSYHGEEKKDLLDNLFPNIPFCAWAVAWNNNAGKWFPSWMGTDLWSFATFNFYLSLVLTFITPFVRASQGVWRAEVPSVYYLNLLFKVLGDIFGFSYKLPLMQDVTYKVEDPLKNMTYQDFTATNTPYMDKAWVMHATAGLTWLCCSYVQIKLIPKYAPSWHPRTGPAVLLVLFIHLGVALNILIHDQQKQNTLNKVALSSLTFIAGTYALIGAYKAVRFMLSEKTPKDFKLITDHKDRMIIGWLWSISGAGPIRIVAAIMEPLGVGPLRCQQAHNSVSTACLWPYFNRLVMIATWNLLMTGLYCSIRKSPTLTTTWVKNIFCHVIVCASFGILGLLPNSMPFVDGLSGCATTDKSWIITYLLWVAQALQLTIFFPLLFVLLSFMGPGMLLMYVLAMLTGVDSSNWCSYPNATAVSQ